MRSKGTAHGVFVVIATAATGAHVAALDTARRTATEWALEREVDVLLRFDADHEGRDVDNLLAHADVALTDENACVVDALGKAELEHLCLQPALEEVLRGEREDVVELVLILIEEAVSESTAEDCFALKDTPWMALVKREKLTSSVAHLAEHELHAPDFTFVPETVLPNQFQLVVKALLLKRPPWGAVCLANCDSHKSSHNTEELDRFSFLFWWSNGMHVRRRQKVATTMHHKMLHGKCYKEVVGMHAQLR